jgi:hypothetical protein
VTTPFVKLTPNGTGCVPLVVSVIAVGRRVVPAQLVVNDGAFKLMEVPMLATLPVGGEGAVTVVGTHTQFVVQACQVISNY